MTMWTARKIIAIVTGVIGALLIARAALDGQLWPLSVQLVAGVLLVVMAVLRWCTLV
jgi:drug/metabolite transporter (DMT)-like permease